MCICLMVLRQTVLPVFPALICPLPPKGGAFALPAPWRTVAGLQLREWVRCWWLEVAANAGS